MSGLFTRQGSLREWLRLLCMDEYTQTLTVQGYDDVDTLTDITWEDLEDIGIKRLGMCMSLIVPTAYQGTFQRLGTCM